MSDSSGPDRKNTYHKLSVINFLELVVAGRIEEAYQKHVDMGGKHHNAYYPAGFPALQKGMIENHAKFPNKQFHIEHVLADGDLVATHSRVALAPDQPVIAVLHLFRF